jgi:cbb3-type cytochrome oxidase subunit 1
VTAVVLAGSWYLAWRAYDAYPADAFKPGEYVPFITIVKYTVPFLQSRTVAGVLMGVGHAAFAILFVLNVMRRGERRQGPTMLDVYKPRQEPAAAPAAS